VIPSARAFAGACWIDIVPRHVALPDLPPLTLLHAGPPYDGAPPPAVRQAAMQALCFEGLAADARAAAALLDGGAVRLEPAQDHGVAMPLAQVVSGSMLLHAVRIGSVVRHAPLVEAPPPALRFGNGGEGPRARLAALQALFGPGFAAQLKASPVDLAAVIAAGLLAGDECHGRTMATNASLRERIAALDPVAAAAMAGNPGFVLPVLMAAAAAALAHHAADIAAIGGNGWAFGVRHRHETAWRCTAAPPPAGTRLAGQETTQPLGAIGDSAVLDTCGLGGQALAAAPALVAEWRDHLPVDALTRCAALLDPATGIVAAHRVVAAGRGPLVNLAILDAAGASGLIGRGLIEVPPPLFTAR
jgi:hypothetical protein